MTSILIQAGPGWLAVDKPSGMSVHNDPEGKRDAISLVQEALDIDLDLRRQTGWAQGDPMPSPVHRLDKETSGVLLLATSRSVASKLQQAFEQRTTRKIYRAILRGRLAAAEGIWNAPLTDKAEGRKSPAGPANLRKTCLTRFRRLRQNDHLTEIEVELESGRQHQIRRHAALAGHAIVGDLRYGDPKHAERIRRMFGFSRLMLHAMTLEIPRPGEAAGIQLYAPLPTEFDRLFQPVASEEKP
jgi:RluA family pseudouridine synthase